jgi:hypothetical protein
MEDKSLNKHQEKRKGGERPYNFLSIQIQEGQGQSPHGQRNKFFYVPKWKQTVLQPKG